MCAAAGDHGLRRPFPNIGDETIGERHGSLRKGAIALLAAGVAQERAIGKPPPSDWDIRHGLKAAADAAAEASRML
jgi:hypothetical protein